MCKNTGHHLRHLLVLPNTLKRLLNNRKKSVQVCALKAQECSLESQHKVKKETLTSEGMD